MKHLSVRVAWRDNKWNGTVRVQYKKFNVLVPFDPEKWDSIFGSYIKLNSNQFYKS